MTKQEQIDGLKKAIKILEEINKQLDRLYEKHLQEESFRNGKKVLN